MYLNKTSGNLNPRGQQPQSNMQETTIRSFEGGLNVTDTDLNMSPRYAKVLDNLERAIDGSLAVRPGTKLFSNQLTDTTDILNCYYFNTVVVTVQKSGAMYKVAGDGTATALTISGGHPFTAGATEVNFSIFNSDLIICNGQDKPILISGNPLDANYMQAVYLEDLATLSNTNTPVGKYVIAHSQYLCIAGVPSAPSTIYISARDTSGTFVGDPAPNDAVSIDLGSRISLGSSTITGMVAYRDKLLIAFERGILPLTLGVYTTGTPSVHTPTDDGFIEEFGCLTHRSLVSLGDDTFYCDNIGVNSIARIALFNTLRPLRVSHLISPMITAMLQPLTHAQISTYVFAVYDMRNFRYMLFVPAFDGTGALTETVCFSYTHIPALKIDAWARLRGWKWQAACRTSLQNIIFAGGNKLYSYDFDNQTTGADLLGDAAVAGGTGNPITFAWELPWADFKKRMDIKTTRYIGLDTQGGGTFTLNAYVDNIKVYNGVDAPMLSMEFMGGGSSGYGATPYGDSPYGGGRSTSDERLYAWTTKFKLLKLSFIGSTKAKLRFVSVTLGYIHGSIRR